MDEAVKGGTGDAQVTPVPPGPERYRYRGPAGDFEFDAWNAREGGRSVERGGQVVESVDLRTIRWAGDRSGEEPSEADLARLAMALGSWYRRQGVPFDLHHVSGEIEDETGRRRPGFRGVLPRIRHSDGWSLRDEFMSPDFPDASTFPARIEYQDPDVSASMERRIEVRAGIRQRVLVADSLEPAEAPTGRMLGGEKRAEILARIRSVYDHLGAPYRVE